MRYLFGIELKGISISYKDLFSTFVLKDIADEISGRNLVGYYFYYYDGISENPIFSQGFPQGLYLATLCDLEATTFYPDKDAYSKNIAMAYDLGFNLDSLDSLFGDISDEELEKKVDETIKEIVPKNNDGRDTCYWCGRKTKKIDSGMFSYYDYCEECKK